MRDEGLATEGDRQLARVTDEPSAAEQSPASAWPVCSASVAPACSISVDRPGSGRTAAFRGSEHSDPALGLVLDGGSLGGDGGFVAATENALAEVWRGWSASQTRAAADDPCSA